MGEICKRQLHSRVGKASVFLQPLPGLGLHFKRQGSGRFLFRDVSLDRLRQFKATCFLLRFRPVVSDGKALSAIISYRCFKSIAIIRNL